MFTGIVEETGEIISVNRDKNAIKLNMKANRVLEDVKLGDSISTNGVCLTVTKIGSGSFTADVMPETIRKTNLQFLKAGSRVNLERALKLSDRLGGHLVSGHVDGLAKVISRTPEGNAELFRFKIVEESGGEITKYLVEKGSIAVDGISLTIISCLRDEFSIGIIPHSKENTMLDERQTGDYVNIEVDIIGKYVEKLLFYSNEKDDKTSFGTGTEKNIAQYKLDMERLRELGY